MVINNSVNTQVSFNKNTFAAKNSADKSSFAASQGAVKSSGKFDTFVGMVNQNMQDKLNEKADSVKAQKFALDTARVSWEFESNHRQMKKICENAMKYEEDAQKKFKELQEEKAYYAELDKSKSKYIKEDGKYDLEGLKEGDKLDREALSKAMESVQEKIDSLITGTEKYYAKVSQAYEISGTILSQITGDVGKRYKDTLQPMLSDLPYDKGYDALMDKPVYAFACVSRNENNFLKYSEYTMDDIEGKIESLDQLKEDYLLNKDNIVPSHDTTQLDKLLFNIMQMEERAETHKQQLYDEYA